MPGQTELPLGEALEDAALERSSPDSPTQRQRRWQAEHEVWSERDRAVANDKIWRRIAHLESSLDRAERVMRNVGGKGLVAKQDD